MVPSGAQSAPPAVNPEPAPEPRRRTPPPRPSAPRETWTWMRSSRARPPAPDPTRGPRGSATGTQAGREIPSMRWNSSAPAALRRGRVGRHAHGRRLRARRGPRRRVGRGPRDVKAWTPGLRAVQCAAEGKWPRQPWFRDVDATPPGSTGSTSTASTASCSRPSRSFEGAGLLRPVDNLSYTAAGIAAVDLEEPRLPSRAHRLGLRGSRLGNGHQATSRRMRARHAAAAGAAGRSTSPRHWSRGPR